MKELKIFISLFVVALLIIGFTCSVVITNNTMFERCCMFPPSELSLENDMEQRIGSNYAVDYVYDDEKGIIDFYTIDNLNKEYQAQYSVHRVLYNCWWQFDYYVEI